MSNSGYHDCPCRDCFEIAIGETDLGESVVPALCLDCERAGCDGDSACLAERGDGVDRFRVAGDAVKNPRLKSGVLSGVRVIGTVGDVNPIEHAGGFILKRAGETPWIEFTHGLSDDDLDEISEYDEDGEPNPAYLAQKVTVYRVDLEIDGEALLRDLDWCDLGDVERSCGYTEPSPWGNLRSAKQRARLVEDVAGHYGWHELDSYPLEMTLGELKLRWEI